MVTTPQSIYYPQYMAQPVMANNAGYRPKSSVDSVKIDIINPKVSNEPVMPQGYYPAAYQPYYPNVNPQNIYNNYNPNVNATYPVTQNNVPPQPQPQPVPQPQPQPVPQPQPQPQPSVSPQPSPSPSTQPSPSPSPQPQSFGNISDDLIKAIENTLNNPDPNIRIAGAAKLMSTYEKNPDAANHPAMTVLLNRVLKDPHQNVRAMGEIAVQVGANGNEDTKKILGEMTKSDKAYGQDAIAANAGLIEIASRVTTPPQNNTAQNAVAQQAPQQKLNLVA